MAWLNKLSNDLSSLPTIVLAAVAFASATLVGCNVGKTDTVTTTETGTTSTSTTGASGVKAGCAGSYVGGYNMPNHETRIAQRNQSLKDRGIQVTGNDEIDNANAGGGPPDGGIWMAGTLSFETDANCNVISGKTYIFFVYEYDISGTVNKDGTFALVWSGQGSVGNFEGRIESNNTLTGVFRHPAPGEYIVGDIWGTFTPSK